MKFRGHSRYINIRVVLNAKCINIKRGSKFSWLLKIFGSIHDVSNISHYFACYLELYNQKKKMLSIDSLFLGILQMLFFLKNLSM